MVNFTTKQPPLDPITGKATSVNLFNASRPHMRALHFSWFCFLIAFMSWFAVAPLLPSIQTDLKLTSTEVGDSNIASVSSTIIFRVASGPLCERFGSRRVMASLLIIGSIPTALVGLAQGPSSFTAIRFFIGILGATFVPCQYWTTHMFNSNTVGRANALAAGWGNMGGGLIYLLMPLVYLFFNQYLPNHLAWRVSMLVPATLCLIVGLCCLFFTDDCPEGKWSERSFLIDDDIQSISTSVSSSEKNLNCSKTRQNIEPHRIPVLIRYLLVFINPNVVLMMLMYACCFGVEVAVDNIIGLFLVNSFGLNQTTAGLFGSIFGLLNIFSRMSGGLTSDFANKKMGVRGRLLAQFLCFFLQGAFLILFRFLSIDLTTAIILIGCFSWFTQACCGTSYSIVPYIDPAASGIVTGLVGAGGNIGGLIFAAVFKAFAADMRVGFMIVGLSVIAVSLVPFVMSINGRTLIFGTVKRSF